VLLRLLSPLHYYLRRRLASGEGIVSLGVRHAVCVSAALVSAAKVMRCIQCSLVFVLCPRVLCIFVRSYFVSVCVQLKELNHDNIKAFIGACVEPGRICYLMHSCSRGTLQVCIPVTRRRRLSHQPRSVACELIPFEALSADSGYNNHINLPYSSSRPDDSFGGGWTWPKKESIRFWWRC